MFADDSITGPLAPEGPLRVISAHPLAAGLLDCFVFNQGSYLVQRNLAPGSQGKNDAYANASGSPIKKRGRWGLGVHLPDGFAAWEIQNRGEYPAGDFTFRVMLQGADYQNSFFNALWDHTSGGQYFRLFVDKAGTFDYQSVGGTDGSISVSSGGRVVEGNNNDIILTRSGSTCSIWVDSILRGTFSSSGTALPSSGHLTLGRNPSAGGVGFHGTYFACMGWRRCLSPEDITSLYANPFQMLTVDADDFIDYGSALRFILGTH